MANKRSSKDAKSFKRPQRYSASKRWLTRAVGIGGALGVFSLLMTTTYNFLVGDVSLAFVKSHGRYYDFNLENNSPADQLITRFKVDYPPQHVIGHVTRQIAATASGAGGYELPGGNVSEIPVSEFHDLDGKVLPANKVTPFLMPPTNSKNYVQLDAAVFDITFETAPTNAVLGAIDETLKTLKLRNRSTKQRYLVVDNLWIPTNAATVADAVRIACRDDQSLSDLCNGHNEG
ncbi:hypothetical protein NPS29_00965 [Pseudomonas putida]|uniref:hypothetical protein n=1 Tax=Pseudomonas putida TaxID=303 RepID=UPI002364965A|nr:hypothetical protein [Pseudomonas putida]MDD1963880.1 hypothetical protein [Pseudomonas putida]